MPHDSLWDDELVVELAEELKKQEGRPKIYERNPDNGKVRWRYINDHGNEKMMQDAYDFDKHIHMKILEREVEIIRSRFKDTDTGNLRTAVSVLEKRIEELKNGL
jgi:hypothetical protein